MLLGIDQNSHSDRGRLGMVEIEGSDILNFIRQTDRVGQTHDTHTITTCIVGFLKI